MKLNCMHGYFKFFAEGSEDIGDFLNLYPFDLVAEKDYYTFSFLEDAPKYSLQGGTYLGAIATKTFEGEPWEILRENGLVYDFLNDVVVPIATITQLCELQETNRYFIADGLVLPGSLTDDGDRVTDYSAFYYNNKFEYNEVTFE